MYLLLAGGVIMIRTKTIIHAQSNNSKRVTTTETLTGVKLLKASGSREIVRVMSTKRGIFYTDANGNASFLALTDGDETNKILATDQYGNLYWKSRPTGGS